MDRKKTILIAVMINAGLLVVLFIAAIFSQDEASGEEIVQASSTIVAHPLFPKEADVDLQKQELPSQAIAVFTPPVIEKAQTPQVLVADTTVHKLPPLQQEVVVAMPSHIGSKPGLEVTVKKGDSLEKIAKAHHTTVEEMIRLNQLPGSFLRVGQVLKIPDTKVASSSKKSITEAPIAASTGPEYYMIKVGDNPWGIAMKHHMKVEELLKLNQLNEERARKLKPGDRLRIR